MAITQRKGRILAFQALYAWEAACFQTEQKKEQAAPVRQEIPEALLNFEWLDDDKRVELGEDTGAFSRLLIVGVIENIAAIDAMIKQHLENWVFSRVSRVDLALLRLSVYTLMYQKDVPVAVAISEALSISKKFGEDGSFRFINGVLDAIRKTLEG
jgi:N utilization substance protein B